MGLNCSGGKRSLEVVQGTFPHNGLVSEAHFIGEGPQYALMPRVLLPGCSPGQLAEGGGWCCVGVESLDVALQEQPPSAKFAVKSC